MTGFGAGRLPLVLLLLGLAAPPTLAVRLDAGWREWWRADAAPVRWPAP
ncbi:MAG: hypothetical protein H0W67_07080, partial [Gemmatimonadales bacterium]|nr:hypothetical protein [Gemmatimonadales bacterium]